ncbi:DUF2087 domain-containing protein [Leifsonia sp. NPDC058194]|uniref:DUF2087 domain-containing protein n=1 Tax=Leifsonia sp. NPDC058194 TaxID=3346374 RepID=UPI0036DC7618
MPATESADWRPIVAALANVETRRLFAEIELGADLESAGAGLSPSRRQRALDALTRAGLVAVVDGSVAVVGERFVRALRDAPARPARTGVDRFLDAEGRIDRFPSSAADRDALLRHIAAQVLPHGEAVGEAELGERLARFGDDTAALRRHLVDAGILGRTASGSSYTRITGD